MLRCGGSQRVALDEEAVAKQPEDGENSRSAITAGLALSSLCPGGISPVLLRNQGSQGPGRRLDQEWPLGLETSKLCSWHALHGCCLRLCDVKGVK